MPTREQVRALLTANLDYREAGRQLGISPGLAYLIATGKPADGSEVPGLEERLRRGLLSTSQNLAHPPPESPAAGDTVHRWIAERVRADEQMRGV